MWGGGARANYPAIVNPPETLITQVRPFFAVPWGNIGFVLLQLGDSDKAIPALQKAIPAQWLDTAERRQAQREAAIARHRYAQETLLQAIDAGLKARHPGQDAQAMARRRQALAQAFGPMLRDPASWGDANSPGMIARLREAGLTRLWLGLPQWTAGLARPEGVAAAREAGYLIAPYDSYDTALPEQNDQPAWLTAQMGQEVFRRCAVVNRDGTRRTGFGGRGVYVNPACVRPVMQRRVPALQAASHYNSWFLDVAATGMAFDDHDPAKPTSQAQDIDNRMAAAAWIGEQLGVVVGSEDGFAVANRTVAFAHGAQTRGFLELQVRCRRFHLLFQILDMVLQALAYQMVGVVRRDLNIILLVNQIGRAHV